MRLSKTEIKLLLDIAAARGRRRREAWIAFLSVIGLFIATYHFELLPLLKQSELMGIAMGATTTYLIHVYLAVRPEDKLIDLLQRYVNRDPEALEQFSHATETGSTAA